MPSREFEIIEGPSKEGRFGSLRLAHDGRRVEFTVKLPRDLVPNSKNGTQHKTCDVRIKGICVGEAPGEVWGLKVSDGLASLGSTNLRGHYNTKTRKGWLLYV